MSPFLLEETHGAPLWRKEKLLPARQPLLTWAKKNASSRVHDALHSDAQWISMGEKESASFFSLVDI